MTSLTKNLCGEYDRCQMDKTCPVYSNCVRVEREFEVTLPEPMPGPTPFLRGTFAIYETPDGGYHIAYKPDNQDETQHAEIPGAALKMAQALSGAKNPFAMFSALRKGGKNGSD